MEVGGVDEDAIDKMCLRKRDKHLIDYCAYGQEESGIMT